MNVFDFDNTIYDGDSTLDFYLFCLRKYPRLCCYIPHQVLTIFLYKFKKTDITITKEKCYTFLSSLENSSELIEEFWNIHIHKIKKWYLKKHMADDVIISASPEFLLRPICNKLSISNLIASRVDISTGEYIGVNCSEEEKVRRFSESYPEIIIDEFYFDSDSDIPLAKLARAAYRVSGSKIDEWKS